MADDSRKRVETEAKVRWNRDTIDEAIRERIRETIEAVLEEELDAALGGRSLGEGGRAAARLSARQPRPDLTTSVGPTRVEVPRARLQTDTGRAEWQRDPAAVPATHGPGG
jgi:transposase-like protein